MNRQGVPISVSRAPAPGVGKQGEQGKEDDKYLGEEGEWNVILWADHRAEEEAEGINGTGEGVLGFVGGTMSVSTGHERASQDSSSTARVTRVRRE